MNSENPAMSQAWEYSASARRVLCRARQLRPAVASDSLAVLLALLEEEESPGAKHLERRQVTKWEVQQNLGVVFPLQEVSHSSQPLSFVAPLRGVFAHLNVDRWDDEITTEHLLLALVVNDGPVADFLANQGLDHTFLTEGSREIAAMESEWQSGSLPDPYSEFPTEQACEEGWADFTQSRSNAEAPQSMHSTYSAFADGSIRTPPMVAPDAASLPSLVQDAAVWRALDAQLNRGAEGFRVVEDYVRFVLNSAPLTEWVKQLRHQLQQVAAGLNQAQRLVHRNVPNDVGVPLTLATEAVRNDLTDIARINCKRVQESLRGLEEFSKLVAVELSQQFKALRYESYRLEVAILSPPQTGATSASSWREIDHKGAGSHAELGSPGYTLTEGNLHLTSPFKAQNEKPVSEPTVREWLSNRREQLLVKLAAARLYVLLPGGRNEREFRQLALAVLEGGADVIQLRDKQLLDDALLHRGNVLMELAAPFGCLCIINDRPDLALACGAHGVHVGQEELPVEVCREILGPVPLIGLSTHTAMQVELARERPVDYLGVGPMFASNTKQFTSLAGLEFASAASQLTQLPTFAIGGIQPHNLVSVLETGVQGVAVGGAIVDSLDPCAAARWFAENLRQHARRVHDAGEPDAMERDAAARDGLLTDDPVA